MLERDVERLKTNVPGVIRRIPLSKIDAVVTGNLGPARVRGNARPAVFYRQIAMYLAHRVGGWTTTRIGKFYNGRDHSTVCHAIHRIDALRKTDDDLSAVLDVLAAACETEGVPVPERSRHTCAGNLQEAVLRHIDSSFVERLAERIAERVLARVSEHPEPTSRLTANG